MPSRFSRPAFLSFVALVLLTLGSCVLTVRFVDSNEDEQLERRSQEVSAILSTSLAEVRSALTVLSSLTGAGQREAFETASTSLVTGNVRSIALVEDKAGSFAATSSSGDLLVGDEVAGDRLDLVTRAIASTDVVTDVIQVKGELRVGYALRSTLNPSAVVIRETTINPARLSTAIRGHAFGDIDASLYAGPTAAADQLVLTTSSTALTTGHREAVNVGADTWLLITKANAPLQSRIIEWSPWIVLLAGLMLTLSLSAVVETLSRRRVYAERLVEARTAELEAALVHQTELEAGERAARKEAELANHAKNAFLSRMSHELRTPLNGVLGFAQILDIEHLDQTQRDSVRQILKGGWHLLDLINEVLDISRIESGNMSLSPEPVLACEVLDESISLLRPLADEMGIRIESDSLPGCEVHVLADRQRVKQVMLNLISNAVKYNRVGGSVEIHCERVDDMLRIHVTDTGPGINDDDLDRLFTPFERLGAENGTVEGTGIGLALSQKLAAAMSGDIAVRSTAGIGSTFTLALPVVEGQDHRYERLPDHLRQAPVPPSSSVHTVLYIEDNLSNLRLVTRIFEARHDLQIVPAMQGSLGLELARRIRPSVILLDLHLPDLDGAEVLRQLRDDPNTASIPVIIVSADATPGQILRLRNEGAYAYITKPLNITELTRIISEAVPTAAD